MKRYFLIVLVVVVMQGCVSVTCAEREAHKVNSDRYIPMLKTYIEADESLHDNLKETYYIALDEWKELIDSKYKHCVEGESDGD